MRYFWVCFNRAAGTHLQRPRWIISQLCSTKCVLESHVGLTFISSIPWQIRPFLKWKIFAKIIIFRQNHVFVEGLLNSWKYVISWIFYQSNCSMIFVCTENGSSLSRFLHKIYLWTKARNWKLSQNWTFSRHFISRRFKLGRDVTILEYRVMIVLHHNIIRNSAEFCISEKCWPQCVILSLYATIGQPYTLFYLPTETHWIYGYYMRK